jgi:hypothetical protein
VVYVDAKAGDHHEGDVRGEENHKIEKYAKVHCARNLAVENPSGGTQLGGDCGRLKQARNHTQRRSYKHRREVRQSLQGVVLRPAGRRWEVKRKVLQRFRMCALKDVVTHRQGLLQMAQS